MKEFRSKLGEDGRIVIPALYRKQLQLKPGEDLIIKLSENELHVLTAKQSLKKAQRKIMELTKGASLVKELKTLRKEDFNDE